MIYREGTDTRYGWQPSGSVYEGFVILLSVPDSRRGGVVASVKSAARAADIAAEVSTALDVAWQQL